MSPETLTVGSHLERLLRAGQFVVTAEINPPRSADRAVVERKAAMLRGAADAFNVTDCPTAVVRMSSLAGAAILVGLGLEPILEMTTRDRNIIGAQSDLLGAAALGVKNLLCITGDAKGIGDHPEAKDFHELNSFKLLELSRRMRDEKRLASGYEMKKEPRFFLGAVDQFEPNPAKATTRLKRKVSLGAQFIQTQIIYDLQRFMTWMKQVRDEGLDGQVFILAGTAPLKSVKMAEYLNEHVPGVVVPPTVIKRMKGAKDEPAEGRAICLDVIEAVRAIPGVAGIHVMAPTWEEVIPEIVQQAGLLPRPQPIS